MRCRQVVDTLALTLGVMQLVLALNGILIHLNKQVIPREMEEHRADLRYHNLEHLLVQAIKLVSPDLKLGSSQAASLQMVRSGKSALLEQAPANLASLAHVVSLSK